MSVEQAEFCREFLELGAVFYPLLLLLTQGLSEGNLIDTHSNVIAFRSSFRSLTVTSPMFKM